jgi:glycine oxidase
MDDVLVIGGGVMGCASALALTKKGLRVRVLERSVPGAEASSAAAGIVGAQVEAHADGPMTRLCVASRALYPAWSDEIRAATGIDVGLRRSGVMRVALDDGELRVITEETAWQAGAGLTIEALDGSAARAREPALAEEVRGAIRFPDDARIDPPLLLRGLRIAAELAGARFQSGAYVRRIAAEGGRVRGVSLEDGSELRAGHVVLAAGSWSGLVEGSSLPADAVRPARGQIVELTTAMPALRGVIFGPGCYLSPRDDGRLLVGSTLEFVGFRPGVTAGAVRDLLTAAIRLVPRLADASVSRTWSSFRPYTRDELPLLGQTSLGGLVLATGHYRNGILLAPITGAIVAALVAGEPLPAEATPFAEAARGVPQNLRS